MKVSNELFEFLFNEKTGLVPTQYGIENHTAYDNLLLFCKVELHKDKGLSQFADFLDHTPSELKGNVTPSELLIEYENRMLKLALASHEYVSRNADRLGSVIYSRILKTMETSYILCYFHENNPKYKAVIKVLSSLNVDTNVDIFDTYGCLEYDCENDVSNDFDLDTSDWEVDLLEDWKPIEFDTLQIDSNFNLIDKQPSDGSEATTKEVLAQIDKAIKDLEDPKS